MSGLLSFPDISNKAFRKENRSQVLLRNQNSFISSLFDGYVKIFT